MPKVVIKVFDPLDEHQIEEIFFESSTRKTFPSESEKDAFKWKYLGNYLKNYPELALVGKFNEKVIGYVCGSTHSDFALQPHLKIFEEEIQLFPAHLHINCHSESRGLGLGSSLVKSLETKLKDIGAKGLHIMTGPDSKNRSFYQKLGFNFEVIKEFEGRSILMMGKSLTSLVGDY